MSKGRETDDYYGCYFSVDRHSADFKKADQAYLPWKADRKKENNPNALHWEKNQV